MKHLFSIILGVLFFLASNAQTTPAKTDVMQSNGKIYVVMVVVLVILIGLFVYLWSVDRKISRLEKKD